MLHNRPLCHLSEKQPQVGRDHLLMNAVAWRTLAQLSAVGLAGGDGCIRLFALRDFHVGGFDFRDGIQPPAELTTASTEIPPFCVPRPSIGSNSGFIELLFKS